MLAVRLCCCAPWLLCRRLLLCFLVAVAPSGRCFGVHLFEIFREKIRYFENFDQWSKYCRCRMGDHEVRVFAHHWVQHRGHERQREEFYSWLKRYRKLVLPSCRLRIRFSHKGTVFGDLYNFIVQVQALELPKNPKI